MVAEAMVQESSVFAAFDKDGDGKISAAELRGSMTAALGEDVSDEEAAEILAAVDADGDGLLDQEEFSRLGAADDEVRRRCMQEAFAMYAAEGGDEGARITPASLMRMLGKLLESSAEKMELEECRAMICRFDLDGDGVISFDEFMVMMMGNV
jgi:calcium-binding protein CML